MRKTNVWKLQDAKARFSELVRKARAGAPQKVTVHGKDAVVVLDPDRFEFRPKPRHTRTMADFIEGSKKYRGVTEGIEFERVPMPVRDKRREIFDGDFLDEELDEE
ncbi:MAG: type II toxin-antitoxin system prevent-host-death family antitoxin [Xanthobacteraceae bacterium]|jgi:prevent-host-death family protein